MVIDHVVRLATRGKRRYDALGKLAAGGQVNHTFLARLMRHKFLRREPPKSSGREDFGAAFSENLYRRARAKGIAPRDILATVTAFTARSIARSYLRFLVGPIDEVILSGGGAHNRTLVRMLEEELADSVVITSEAFGIDPDAKEAISFAILACETIRGVAGNVPSATGARHPVILGKIVAASRCT